MFQSLVCLMLIASTAVTPIPATEAQTSHPCTISDGHFAEVGEYTDVSATVNCTTGFMVVHFDTTSSFPLSHYLYYSDDSVRNLRVKFRIKTITLGHSDLKVVPLS